MTAPLLPIAHGGRGTGRRNIFAAGADFLGRKALPALFGGGQIQSMPGEPNPLGGALSAAGNAIVQATGGPRQFGTFGPTPLAAISAGLTAGREVYQDARRSSQRRAAYDAIPLPAEGPTAGYLTSVAAEAMRQGDEPYARSLLSVLASGNAVGQPTVGRNTVLGTNERLVGPDGQLIAEGNPANPAARVPATHYVVGPGGKVQAVIRNEDGTYTTVDTGATARTPAGKTAGAVNETQANSEAAVARLTEANQLMTASFNRNPRNMTIPWRAAVPRLLADMARATTGGLDNPVSDGLDQVGLNEAQQEYRPMTDEWTHQYIVFLPRFRSGKDMYNNVKHAYFPPIGVTNVRVLRSYEQRRESATRSIIAARSRGATPEEIENILIGDMERHLGRRIRPAGDAAPATGTSRGTTRAPATPDDYAEFERTP